MMERNHRNTDGQHRVSLMPGDDLGSDPVTEKVSDIGNHGFPRRYRLSDDPVHDGSEDFVPRIITRMPDLTGYGHDTAPQSISLSRPKHGRWTFPVGILKKFPLHKWKYAAAIAVVVAILAWSLFKGSDSLQVAKNPLSGSPKTENMFRDKAAHRESSTQESNPLQFEGFSGFPPIPASSTSADQPLFFNGTTASPTPQNQFFGTGTSQYPSGSTLVAMVTPESPARDLAPWERQPNNTQPNNTPPNNTMVGATPTSPQYDFRGNADLPMTASAGNMMANNSAMTNNGTNSAWPGYPTNVGSPGVPGPQDAGPAQWNSNNAQPYPAVPGNPPYVAQQNTYSQNSYPQDAYQAGFSPQNGQFQPASPQQGFANITSGYGSSAPLNTTGTMAGGPQPNGGYVTSSQQSYYPLSPAENHHAVAMNTTFHMPSYPQGQMQGQGPIQGQGQWPPQNTGNAPFPGDGNKGFNMQQPYPYPENGSHHTADSQYAMQNNTQFAPQRQQPFPPYNNMAVLPSPETYR